MHAPCWQVWNDEDQDDEVLAMVVRTGCNSTIGNMLRQAVRPSSFLSAADTLVTVSSPCCFPISHAINLECAQVTI